MNRLQGRVALVFGGSPNIAGTTAHAFAREGARVAVCDQRAEVAEAAADYFRGKGYEAVAITGDPTDEREAERIVAQAVAHYGHIDILFNQVGAQYRHGLLDFNLHDWDRQLRGYLTGGMLTTKHGARAMVQAGVRGSIIHVASDAAHQGEAGNTGYNAAKGGLVNFCRGAAMELAEHGIRVNTMSPIFMDHLLWQYPAKMLNPAIRGPHTIAADDFLQGIPLGRLCNARDVAQAAVFLASEESSFITGFDMMLDGGARAGYWCWQPGRHQGSTTGGVLENLQPHRYGDPVDDIEFDY